MDDFEKKNLIKQVNLSLILLLFLLVLACFQIPKKRLGLVFCNVGQGDATLVSWGKYQMLVDGGPDSSVLSCLGKNMPFWDRKIELVVVTHPQADHMTGIIEVLKRYKVDRFYMSKVDNPISEIDELKRVIKSTGVSHFELKQGDLIKLGPVNLEVLFPIYQDLSYVKDVNEVSTVILGSFGNFDFLLIGDIDEAIEDQLRLTNKLREVEVLKVAHHGSKYSSSMEFLEVVKPKLAVIEVGENRFGHPTKEVLERFRVIETRVMRTDENGAVKVISDGKRWWVK